MAIDSLPPYPARLTKAALSALAGLVLAGTLLSEARSQDLWVALDGAKANPGTQDKPFATIQQAVDAAQPGTTIHVGAGLFLERITFRKSGEAGKAITLQGALSEGSKKATRIDGGTKVEPAVWGPAPEVAPGVYKTTSFKTEPEFVTLDGLSLARLNREAGAIDHEDGTRKFTALEVLAWPDGPVPQAPVANVDVWSALGGAYTYQDGTTYVRLKNGDDVRNHTVTVSPSGAVVALENAGHIVLKNLEIGGGEVGVVIQGERAQHNRVEDCRLVNGRVRLRITGSASDSTVANSYLSMGFLGKLPGPWWSDTETSPPSEELKIRRFLYRYFKTFASVKTTSDDRSFQINGGSTRTTLEGNHLEGGIIGIEVGDTTELTIKNNRIQNQSSVGMALRGASNKVYVANNDIRDCNISIRLHELNSPAGHEVYIWNNRCVQPEGTGTQFYCHFFTAEGMPKTPSPARKSISFIYHNTFLGGFRGVYIPRPTAANCPELIIVNNVFALQQRPFSVKTGSDTPDFFVRFDYNWIIGGLLAENNLPGNANIITPTGVSMDASFIVQGENLGRQRGVDVSQKFTLKETSFDALPGFAAGYFSGDKPDLGAQPR